MNPDNNIVESSSVSKPQLAETEKTSENPYSNSSAAKKMKQRKEAGQPVRLAVLDIDSTMTGTSEDDTNKARKDMEEQGYVVVFNTARTSEMVISENQRKKSEDFKRPPALLGKDDSNKQVYKDPAEVVAQGILDGDLIAGSTGTEIFIKQEQGGYAADNTFIERQKAESLKWRSAITAMVDYVNRQKISANTQNGQLGEPLAVLKPFENPANYQSGATDVYTPDLRVQMDFKTAEDKLEFLQNLRDLRNTLSELHTELKSLRKQLEEENSGIDKEKTQQEINGIETKIQSYGVDESTIDQVYNFRLTDDSKPSENKYAAYLSPSKGYKARSTNHMITSLAEAAGVPLDQIDVLIAGDSKPDELMGLLGGLGTNSTFLLVGGSRLTSSLTDSDVQTYSGRNVGPLQNRLKPSERKGQFTFQLPRPETTMKFKDPTMIIADQAFPETKGPQSIIAFLESKK